jgi:hypothetical protein
MAITNNNKPTIDLPTWEVLQPLPAAAAAGVTACHDKRGNDRYIYIMISATSFWRYDVRANSYQQLASPPGGTLGAGTCMLHDPVNGYIWALITSGTGAPTWQYYSIAANTWTARSVTNLPGTFGTDGSAVFPCIPYGGASNDLIYLVGNAATVFYIYTISSNTWATGTAVTAAPGAGCALVFLPAYSTTKLICLRGGATATVYEYNISTPGWSTLTFVPATETFTTGTMITTRWGTDKIIVHRNATGICYEMDMSALTITPLCTEYLLAFGAAHVGDRLFYVITADAIEFLYIGLHTSANMLRSALIF